MIIQLEYSLIFPIHFAGDYLRIWRVGGHHGAGLEVMLNNVQQFN
jgi:hypothetical protein